jgi:hypothetical protein
METMAMRQWGDRIGDNGAKVWTQNTDRNLVPCSCGFIGDPHYKVRWAQDPWSPV